MHLAAARSPESAPTPSAWMNVKQAAVYTRRTEWEVRTACQASPITGKPALTHTRGSKDKLLFLRDWLDEWNLLRVRRAEQGPSY
jgi:hypothetical protein